MATGLGGGIGGTREEVCGALSGGVLVIGGVYGRMTSEEDDDVAYALAARYRLCFLAEFGHTQCAPLREMVESPGDLNSCAELVERAARILLDLFSKAEAEMRASERS